ncbi:MAG: hypothetical protein AAGA48_13265, partial [Myxococcota bacterium]
MMLWMMACSVPPSLQDAAFPTLDSGFTVASCEGVLPERILQDTSVGPGCLRIGGSVEVGDPLADPSEVGPTLTIAAGTVLLAEAGNASRVVVHRGARMVALGTATEPIVFTSSARPGTRQAGDWGGLVLHGAAPTNAGAIVEIPGLGLHGGSLENHDSGRLSYVRIEFAGAALPNGTAMAGLGLYGVGAATELEDVQIHRSAGDGLDIRGGTVGLRRVVVTGSGEDALDWTDGWRGHAQFLILQQWPDGGDNGIEADNNAIDNERLPRSAPTLSQFTVIAAPSAADGDIGVLFRQGTGGWLQNGLVASFDGGCITVANLATQQAAERGELVVSEVLLDCVDLVNVPDKTVSVQEAWANVVGVDLSEVVPGLQKPETPQFCTSINGALPLSDPFFEPSRVV